jgi:hypothetical protein
MATSLVDRVRVTPGMFGIGGSPSSGAHNARHAREAGSIASLGLASGTVTVRGIRAVLVREDTGVFASRHVGPLRARQSIG